MVLRSRLDRDCLSSSSLTRVITLRRMLFFIYTLTPDFHRTVSQVDILPTKTNIKEKRHTCTEEKRLVHMCRPLLLACNPLSVQTSFFHSLHELHSLHESPVHYILNTGILVSSTSIQVVRRI